MSKLVWDAAGSKIYETGVDHGVLYIPTAGVYNKGVVWNGLTAYNASPSGAEANDLYADNIKYASMRSAEKFGFTIEAYTYPDEFEECDGTARPVAGVTIGQQSRKPFGFSCRTLVGSDTEEAGKNYKLHLVYGATASPSEKSYSTVNDSPDAITFSWERDTTPVNVTNFAPTSELIIDSATADPTKLAALEKILYGDDATEARLPLPDEVIQLMTA